MKWQRLCGVVSIAAMIGCAHPISEGLRSQVNPSLNFTQILEASQDHIGQKIVLGGVIVETRNLENTTEIEVVEKKLDSFGYPSYSDQSQGRFLFRKAGYLESEIYAKGREVTGGGTFVGTQKGKIGEVTYDFPVIEVEELKLWDPLYSPYYGYPPYTYGPYGGRYWGAYPRYPYGGPFYPFYYW